MHLWTTYFSFRCERPTSPTGVTSLPLKQVWTAYISSRCDQPTSQAGVNSLHLKQVWPAYLSSMCEQPYLSSRCDQPTSQASVKQPTSQAGVNSIPLKQVWTAYLSSRCEQPTSQAGVNSLPLKQVWPHAYLSSRCEQPTSQAGVVCFQVHLELFVARLPRVELSIWDPDVAVRPSGASLVGKIEHTRRATQMTEIGFDAASNTHAPVHGAVHGDHVMCWTCGVERFWFAVLVTCSCDFKTHDI